jgi:hypothetical protein
VTGKIIQHVEDKLLCACTVIQMAGRHGKFLFATSGYSFILFSQKFQQFYFPKNIPLKKDNLLLYK